MLDVQNLVSAVILLGNGPCSGYLLNFAQALIWRVLALKSKP